LKERHGKEKRPKVLSIGQAGENQKFAAICNDKGDLLVDRNGSPHGLEEVKGDCCKRTQKMKVSCQEQYDALRKSLVNKSRDAMVAQSFRSMGTDAGMDLGMMTGDSL
jgi:aldehyde:ferredoxin oxidoreductase